MERRRKISITKSITYHLRTQLPGSVEKEKLYRRVKLSNRYPFTRSEFENLLANLITKGRITEQEGLFSNIKHYYYVGN